MAFLLEAVVSSAAEERETMLTAETGVESTCCAKTWGESVGEKESSVADALEEAVFEARVLVLLGAGEWALDE